MLYEISTVFACPTYNFALAVWALLCFYTRSSQKSVLGLVCFLGFSIFYDCLFLGIWTSEESNFLLAGDDGDDSSRKLGS